MENVTERAVACPNPFLTAEADTLFPWFAVRTRSNFEQLTATVLRSKGLEEFLPVAMARRRWSDRVKTIEMPLFPGYVFCRLDIQNRLPVLSTPGVVGIVGIGKQPVAIPDHEIASIRSILQSGLAAQPWPFLRVGGRILIDRGPLAGTEGILLRMKGEWRLVASIDLLQRSIAVEVDRDWVKPVRKSAPAARQ
jgi:transcription antitermination factor NusG